jgi:acid stress-induced BolA-like protein IbaG/YrbA
MNEEDIRRMIEAGIPGSWVSVSGDGRHYQAVVVSAAFAGRPLLQQHRLVYAALGQSFRSEALHALSLQTYTPEQWAAAGGG